MTARTRIDCGNDDDNDDGHTQQSRQYQQAITQETYLSVQYESAVSMSILWGTHTEAAASRSVATSSRVGRADGSGYVTPQAKVPTPYAATVSEPMQRPEGGGQSVGSLRVQSARGSHGGGRTKGLGVSFFCCLSRCTSAVSRESTSSVVSSRTRFSLQEEEDEETGTIDPTLETSSAGVEGNMKSTSDTFCLVFMQASSHDVWTILILVKFAPLVALRISERVVDSRPQTTCVTAEWNFLDIATPPSLLRNFFHHIFFWGSSTPQQ